MRRQSLYTASALMAVMLVMASPLAAQDNGSATEAAQEVGRGLMENKANLSPQGREIMQNAMDNMRAKNKVLFDEINAKEAEKTALLKAPVLDKAALEAKESEIKALKSKAMQARSDSMNEALGKLSAEDRAAWAEARGKKMERMRDKFQGHKPMHGMKNKQPQNGQ
ncbi:MAG: periplasmic heavy metal sensor [Alphaproteobacteria bacterium]|nr:periplasmic heavy metal sensor [Alphaproteobacteria bacterium]